MARQTTVFAPLGAHASNGSLGTAVTLTPPAGADFLMIQALSQNVRFTLDGTTPTASVGFQLAVGDVATLPVSTATPVKVIQETAGASVQYQWGITSW